MESGEKELRKVYEEVTTNNVKAILDHGNKTRIMIRNVEKRIDQQGELIRNQQTTINALRQQLSNVQAIVYRGGTDGV